METEEANNQQTETNHKKGVEGWILKSRNTNTAVNWTTHGGGESAHKGGTYVGVGTLRRGAVTKKNKCT